MAIALATLILVPIGLVYTSRATRLMSAVLVAAGIYLMLRYNAPLEGWIKATIHNSSLISFFFAVPLMASILYFEPYQKYLSLIIARSIASPFRFYSAAALMNTMLAALINLAGLHFVHQLLRKTAEKYPAKLFTSALIRGFLPNSLWSPSYISTAFIAQCTQLTWFSMAPIGIAMAIAGIINFSLFGWLEYGRKNTAIAPFDPPSSPQEKQIAVRNLLKLLLQTGVLIFLIMVLEYYTHKSAIVIVPLVAFAGPFLLALVYGKTGVFWGQAHSFFKNRLPMMNNEIVLFSAIGFFGYSLGLSDLPSHIPLLISRWGLDQAYTLLPVIVFSIGLISIIGLHPLITITALAASLPPGSIPLNTVQLAGAFLAGYMLYTIVCPFSAANLLMASLSGQNTFTLGIKQNGIYAFVNTIVCIGVILLFS